MYKRLFILIEGPDDGRFFDRIVRPVFEEKYDSVIIWEHAQKTPKKIRAFIDSIKAMSANYLFITDINNSPCITHRKQVKHDKFDNIDNDKMVVVRREIESWYLAGLDVACCRKCGVRPFTTTDGITKEQFNSLIPRRFEESRIVFLQEILKYFQVEIAKQKNESFRYFLHKHVGN